MEFLKGQGTADAARLLYQVEVLLLRPHMATCGQPVSSSTASPPSAAEEQQALSCRVQLLAVLGEAVLDESMPAAGVPFFVRLFQEAAQQLLPQHASLKARPTCVKQLAFSCCSCLPVRYSIRSSAVVTSEEKR